MSPVKVFAWVERKKIGLSVRLKFISICLLLCVALICTIFAARGTIRAYQQFEQDHQAVMAGDVNAIDPWMTLPYIARVYRVPASCFYQSLQIPNPVMRQHATLRSIADSSGKPVNEIIREVQTVVEDYRAHRLTCSAPPKPSQPAGSLTPQWYLWKGSLDE